MTVTTGFPGGPLRVRDRAAPAAYGTAAIGGRAVAGRVEALGELLGLSRTRVSPDALTEAGELLDRIGERRRLSLDHTVVALAGATGSGKSSLYNALTGLELSEAGVRRPTTAAPVSCAWDPAGAVALLDRLGLPQRARHTRRSLLDGVHTRPGGADTGLDGLVLLDLPDHDSAAPGHREQADRLLELVDVVVWVLDPEKYADAALHEHYLRPLAGHADVTLLVLNQVDRLPGEAADQVLDDLRRLLDDDGLAVGEHGEAGAVVLATSALTGEGVPELRAALGRIVAERGAANRRLAADLDRTAERLRPLYVAEAAAGLTGRAREDFVDRLAAAVGASAAGQAAEQDRVRAAAAACGTPWRRLRAARNGRTVVGEQRCVRQAASRPVADEAVRTLAARAAAGLPAPWSQAVHEAARRGGGQLPETLDVAAERAGARWSAWPGQPERPGWWKVAGAVQWLLAALAVVGGLWLAAVGAGAVAGAGAGGFDGPLGLPVALLALGGLGGPALAQACRAAARGPAHRYGQAAERRLRDAAADCGRAGVLEPVAAELLRYREVREQFGVLAGR